MRTVVKPGPEAGTTKTPSRDRIGGTMCEHCVEEWGHEITRGVDDFLDEWPDAEFGPAHIVLSDFNCEPAFIRQCLGMISGELARRGATVPAPSHPDELRGAQELQAGRLGQDPAFYSDCDASELAATARFLREWLLPRVEARLATSSP